MSSNAFLDNAIASVAHMTDPQLAAFALLQWSEPPAVAAGALEAFMFADDFALQLGAAGTAAAKATTVQVILIHGERWTGPVADAVKRELARRLKTYEALAPEVSEPPETELKL